MIVYYSGNKVVGVSSYSNATKEKENAQVIPNCIWIDTDLEYHYSCYEIVEGEVVLREDWEDILSAVQQQVAFGSRSLDAARALKKNEINLAAEKAFEAGATVTLDGTEEHIQARPLDKTNLLALRMEAKELITEGASETLPIRTRANRIYQVTPERMVVIADTVNAYAKEVYAKSWSLKDRLAQAITKEEIDVIQW